MYTGGAHTENVILWLSSLPRLRDLDTQNSDVCYVL
jgi:hypothetical protein